MKKYLIPSIKLTIVLLVLVSVVYNLILFAAAQLVPGRGQGTMISANGKTYFEEIGQAFTGDDYFWSRPSATGYNASGSGGSNKGPANPDFLQTVQSRVDSVLAHNPGIDPSEIPVDLVTAGGSGLDPDISVQAALVQIKRIARIRNLPEAQVVQLVSEKTEAPLLGIFGPEKINVLKLNIALDSLHRRALKSTGK